MLSWKSLEVRLIDIGSSRFIDGLSRTDRFKMLQEQQNLTLRDLDDVTKRNRDLYERFTAVDIECNRVTEDLVAANGKMDQLRNECANLRAEKRIWEVSVNT